AVSVRRHDATFFFFFCQAEDGIRAFHVTGVQTCALPISLSFPAFMLVVSFALGFTIAGTALVAQRTGAGDQDGVNRVAGQTILQIGRASCRERGRGSAAAAQWKTTQHLDAADAVGEAPVE